MKNKKSKHTPDTPRSNSGRYGGHSSYKKKGGGKHIVPTNVNDYFRGLGFKIGRDGPNLFKKAIDKLAIYSSTQAKTEVTL